MPDNLNMSEDLLKVLCCPSCKGDSQLEFDEEINSLVCTTCSRKFLLVKVDGPDGEGLHIPQLLLKEE